MNGIGGVFFRARDPKALSAWYETHLGVNHYDPAPWKQREGYTVFARLLRTPSISAGRAAMDDQFSGR